MTLNNVPASVLVGQRIPQITDFQTTNTGGTVNSIELIDTGVSLGVIPRVTPDGLIIMDIEANDSKAGNPADGITIGVSDGIPIQSPIYDDITAITTVAARSGQTVVFGGLITSDRTNTFRGVPYLAQIPVLGHLFRFDTKSEKRQELVFFLTPHIVMNDEELAIINQRESERMSWCMADVVEIHGDPGFTGQHTDPWSDGTPMIYPSLDPTAEGFSMPGSGEPVPAPRNFGPALPSKAAPGDKPFVLPPDQRKEGKPFILPPDQQEEGKPFLETPPESLRGPQGARIELQPQQATGSWRPPNLQEPWQARTATNRPPNYLPQAMQGNASHGASPDENPARRPASADVPATSGMNQPDQGVVPAQYQEPYNAVPAAYYPPVNYPPPYPYPSSSPADGAGR